MRFIYILGILLLIATGFLVYFYRDWLFGTIDGFNTGGASGVMFQLFEQRCTLAEPWNNVKSCWTWGDGCTHVFHDNVNWNSPNFKDISEIYRPFYPTVSKSTGVELCRSLGGRMATYEEVDAEVKRGKFKIDEKTPAMVADSDKTYMSSNNKLVIKEIEGRGFDVHNDYVCGYNKYQYKTITYMSRPHTGQLGGDKWDHYTDERSMHSINFNGLQNNSPSPRSMFNRDGYVDNTLFSKCAYQGYSPFNGSQEKTRFGVHGVASEDRGGVNLNWSRYSDTNADETYGNPVCIAPTAPTGSTVDITFPTRSGKGWANFKNLTTNIRNTFFTRRFQVRKIDDTSAIAATCTVDGRDNEDTPTSPIILAITASTVSLNTPTPAPTSTQTSYHILDLDTVYSQLDIAKIDLPKRRDVVINSELANISVKPITDNLDPNHFVISDTNPSSGSAIGSNRLLGGYSFIKKEMAARATQLVNLSKDYDTSMRTVLSYWNPLGAFIGSNQNNTMTVAQYSNILIKNINSYYDALLLEFQLHPIAFLRKGAINFPSLLNTFKIYKFPTGASQRTYGRDYSGWTSDPPWDFYSNGIKLRCVDNTSDYYYRKGSIADNDFSESSKTNYDHNPDGWWCRHTQGLDIATASCSDGHAYSWWAATCLKEYSHNWRAITDDYYGIVSQATQSTYDINGPKYNRNIDSSWRAVKDTGNPVPDTVIPKRTIAVVGTISGTNISEIEQSISYAMCLNFTDTSRFESQIRISSDDLQLYMSPDASGLPEFKNTLNLDTKTSTITPLNSSYNGIHSGILVTPEVFYLLPFHTRNMINHWATIRFARVKQWSDGIGATSLVSGSKPSSPAWNQDFSAGVAGTPGPAFIAGVATSASIKGSLFGTDITKEKRNAFLNSVARFYYENERANLGTDGGSSAIGYAVMHKILDVFQVGNTIFDIRFEEYRKRGLQFQRKLEALENEYRSYKRMNLSKDDQLSLEENYLKQKTELYNKDDNYIWGQAQDCGVEAQYIVINSANSLFHISQIVVINSAGQNVALGAQVYSPGPDNLDYGNVVDDPRTKVYYDEQTGDQLSVTATSGGADRINPGNTLLATKTLNTNTLKAAKEALLTDGTLTPRWPAACYNTIAKVPLLNSDGRVKVITSGTSRTDINGICYLGSSGSSGSYLEGTGGKYLDSVTGQVNTFTRIDTTTSVYKPLIIDLGQLYNISVVQIILPEGVAATAPMYTVELSKNVTNLNSANSMNMQSVGSPFTANASTSVSGSTMIFRYPGTGDDNTKCPDILYDRFKLARFYTDFSVITADKPWTVRGYSVGIKAALTFDPKYNAGIMLDITVNGGNMAPAYKPDLAGYNLNMGGGSPPPLNCLDPGRIASIFNEYNLLVNSESFRYESRTRTPVIQNPDEIYTATVVKMGKQKDQNTCAYIWTDKVVSNTANTAGYSLLTKTGVGSTTIERYGEFPYPFNTEDFTSVERILDVSSIGIIPATTQNSEGMQNLGIIIPEMYPKSVTLDTANGFCPALPCSDPLVMNSLLNIYNANLAEYAKHGPNMRAISKIHKAITPNPFQCEFLVDTVASSGSNTQRKVLFNVNVVIPNTIKTVDTTGNETANTTCVWLAPPSYTDINNASIPGVTWDFAPDMVDSAPFLTRAYNYALDVMRPFSQRVTEVVNELSGLGSAQLDPAGSGIMNTLVKYRTETAAAAGDIRYFQNKEDEFGNKCITPSLSGSSKSANYPRCRSATMLESLYKYYSATNSSGSTFSKIATMIRTGMTDDEKCDFTFEASDYGTSLQRQPRTTGLRCETQRIPFSCEFEVTTCAYINPEPPLSDIKAIPSEFVQSVWMGSGSDPTKGSGSEQPPITAAGLNASGSQSLQQPPNGPRFLRSIDYVDCASDYGGKSTNTGLTTCANGRAYIKPAGSLMYVLGSWSPGTLPAGITLLSSAPPLDTVKALVPYTIISSAGSLVPEKMHEYRITTSDKLDFGKTYIRAGFYTDSAATLGTQLAYLVPANPLDSPNAFFAQARDIPALTNQFLSYWNKAFKDSKNIGNKIGTITGYSILRADDSITFQATSATFGELGPDDVQYYYPSALYKVYFRIPYNGGSSPIIYKMEPTPKTFGASGTAGGSPAGGSPAGGSPAGGSPAGSPAGGSPAGSPGQFTTISVSGTSGGTNAGSTDDYIVQNPVQISLNQNKFRSFKFTITKVNQDGNSARTRAEIARINFWSSGISSNSGTSGSTQTFSPANINNALVEVAGTYANYTSKTGVCKPGYTSQKNPTNDSLIECVSNVDQSYPAVSDDKGAHVACGIGYYGPIEYTLSSGQKEMRCMPTGYFQDVLNPAMINANMYVPRLRLDVNQTLTVDLNSIQRIDTFSFIIGSVHNRPLTWTLQGSINNIDWLYLYNQQSDFQYNIQPGKKYSFYDPGFFLFSPSTSSMPTSQLGSAPTAVNQRPMQTQLLEETKEGFLNPDATKKRPRHLRWKIMETQRPDALYVHASMLQFHTRAGPVPTDAIKISNPLGIRRKSADAPASLLSASNERRWVDYNKSDLLITLDLTKLPANPIYGFQFAVPANVENSVDFLPARWLLEGSYDGRTWTPIHEKPDRARIMGGASPIYKFSQQI